VYNIHLTNRGLLIWRTKLQLNRPSRLIGNPSPFFSLLPPVFCLLSSVSCLLPKPLGLPSLPRIHESIMQNKANFSNNKKCHNLLYRKGLCNQTTTRHAEKTNPIKPNSPGPPAPGKNPESRSETHIPSYRASIKDRESSIENQASSPFCRAFMASLRKTKPISEWAI